jgi:hypothetical protein
MDLGIGKKKKDEAVDKWRLTADGKICRFGFRKYANNDVYEGEFVDNQRHSKGTLLCFNGDRYEGEWKNDLFNGNGVFMWGPYTDITTGTTISTRRYEGGFVLGKRHGKGAYFSGDGASYIGCFKRGLYHGYGVLRKTSGDTYNGEFAHGKPSGEQLVEFTNGDTYQGIMQLGVFNGKGKFMWANGRGFYDGDWKRGRFHGDAIRVFQNGNKYIGMFRDGDVHGVGTMFYANGDQYMGDWVRGKWHGKGVISFKSGDKYQGSFMGGCFYGEGKYQYKDGGFYVGEYRNVRKHPSTGVSFPVCDGKRHGFGLRVFSNGDQVSRATPPLASLFPSLTSSLSLSLSSPASLFVRHLSASFHLSISHQNRSYPHPHSRTVPALVLLHLYHCTTAPLHRCITASLPHFYTPTPTPTLTPV